MAGGAVKQALRQEMKRRLKSIDQETLHAQGLEAAHKILQSAQYQRSRSCHQSLSAPTNPSGHAELAM